MHGANMKIIMGLEDMRGDGVKCTSLAQHTDFNFVGGWIFVWLRNCKVFRQTTALWS
jgi:hypothetical protein